MNNKFDELTKSMAQSVTRRGALKKFGIGLAGIALACFGLANRAEAGWQAGAVCYGGFAVGAPGKDCQHCHNGYTCVSESWGRKVCTCQ
jgi:hypothetical protein